MDDTNFFSNVNNIVVRMATANNINAFVIAMKREKFNRTSDRQNVKQNIYFTLRPMSIISADYNAFRQNFECLTEN